MNLNDIINQEGKKLITSRYFEMQKEAEVMYGKNTVIFIEIGSFFEIYQSDTVGKASEIAQELNIVLTRKNKSILTVDENNPSLCGIPSVSIDKHLDKLTSENKWTIILVSQEGRPPEIKRKITKIISPGTNVDYLKNEDYNFISSIFIEKNKEGIVYAGLSMIDLGTGKVLSFENYGTKNDKELAIDEIINIIKTNNCTEMIITQNGFDDPEYIENKLSLNNEIIHTSKELSSIKKSLKISYQNEVLKNVFNLQTFLSPIEELDMERTPNALNALILLIDFISEHNMKVVSKLKNPQNVKNEKFLYLGNNALEQLNITSQTKKESLLTIINKGCSAIGKRFISDQLKNPILDEKEINKRHSLPELFEDKKLRENLRTSLKSIYDIERIWRKVSIETINPYELHNLYSSMQEVCLIVKVFENSKISLLDFGLKVEEIEKIKNFIKEIELTFDISKLATFTMTNINTTFVKEGVSKELDTLQRDLLNVYIQINRRAADISYIITNEEVDVESNDPRYEKIDSVNIGFNESEGFYFEITNNKINSVKTKTGNSLEDSMDYGIFTTKKLKNSKKFYFEDIIELNNKIIILEHKIISKNKEIFLDYIKNISLSDIEKTIHFIAYLEFMINNSILKDSYQYSKPIIKSEIEESFVEAIQLRHAIIEQLQTEIFIPNNIVLGKKEYCENKELMDNIYQDGENTTGIMLYGLNSSGKSTTMKSLGIAIILAQAGFYVPAEKFIFKPYENLFTRITGSDNIYKGLSTFAIEMLELKNIFNRANENTLVLGDEIAHGTETVSALSIVASAVVRLVEKKSQFIFATHLHQLKDIKDVSELETVKNTHLEVIYDENSGDLIYNRKLLSGPGSSIYGLEFAKFMKMDKIFLNRAHKIRKEIAADLDGLSLLTAQKENVYNKEKFLGACEICGNPSEELHHIAPQRDADKNGMIKHFSKDHKANLLSVCHNCHMEIEHEGLTVIKKMTSSGLKVITKKEED